MRIKKRKNLKYVWIFIIGLSLLLTQFSSAIVSAFEASNSTGYTVAYNNDGQLQIVQDAYLPAASYVDLGLRAAEDLFILDEYMYIADAGNRRVLRINLEDNAVDIVGGEDIFRNPTGVSADADGRIYVADSGNNEAYRFNSDLELEQVFMKPDSPRFGLNAGFKPLKISPSLDGGVYIVNEGSVAGLVHMDEHGGFLGYFGSSAVAANPFYALADLILTDQQQSRFLSRTPPSFANIVQGPDDLIYSINRGSDVQVVKHNIGGLNILENPEMPSTADAMDIEVTVDGRILILDSGGYVMELTADGYLINIFAGPSNTERSGLFSLPTGIASDASGNIYVLDKEKNSIQMFSPTQSQRMLHSAINFYRTGNYDESISLLEEVLRVNSGSRLANTYMGKNYLQFADYESAAEHFHLSEQIADYSSAFWEIRNDWIQNNLLIIIIIFILLVGMFVYNKNRKRKRNRAINEGTYELSRIETLTEENQLLYDFKQLRYALFNPSDNAYEVTVGRTGTYLSATIFFILAFAMFVLLSVGSGFIFSERIRNFNIPTYTLGFTLLLALFIASNFLIVAIRDGKGTLKDIYVTTAYALSPIIFLFPLAAILGNFSTLNEAFIIEFIVGLAVVWSVILLVSSFMEIHQYSLAQTITTILLALFAMAVAVIAISLIWLVIQQMLQQLNEMRLEVILRD